MKKFLIAVLFIAFYSQGSLASNEYEHAPEPKVWGNTQGNTYQLHGFNIRVSQIRTGGFHRTFYTSFSDRKPGGYGNFVAEFKGDCAPAMDFQIRYLWNHDNELDLSRYKKTGKVKDLPVMPMIDAMRQVLIDQCSGVQALRVKVHGFHSALRDNSYKGTFQKENGWKLEDGFVPLLASADIKQKINFIHANAVKVYYEGTCTGKANINLVYIGNSLASDTRKQANRLGAIKAFVKRYREICAGEEVVAVRPSSLPKHHRCKSDTECHHIFTKENNWNMVSSSILYEEPDPYTFATIIKTLSSDDPHAQKQDKLFKLFFVSYMEQYGDNCRHKIANPVEVQYDYEEVTRDGQGYELSRDHLNSQTLYLDKGVAPLYDKYMRQRNAILAQWALTAAAKARANSQIGADSAFDAVRFYKGNENHIKRLMTEGCDSKKVALVYDRAVNLATN